MIAALSFGPTQMDNQPAKHWSLHIYIDCIICANVKKEKKPLFVLNFIFIYKLHALFRQYWMPYVNVNGTSKLSSRELMQNSKHVLFMKRICWRILSASRAVQYSHFHGGGEFFLTCKDYKVWQTDPVCFFLLLGKLARVHQFHSFRWRISSQWFSKWGCLWRNTHQQIVRVLISLRCSHPVPGQHSQSSPTALS